MYIKILPAALLALLLTGSATAQTKDRSKKDETITIRKKTDSKEKITIVVDGDNITINGKPLEDMKDADIEVLRNKGIGPLMPGIRAHIAHMAAMGGMKMFGDAFPFAGNSAFLGVVSEKNEKGVTITSVEKESAAEKAGLKKEDIITKVGDTKIENSTDLYDAIGKYKPEDKATITYLRDGKEATTTATLSKNKSADIKEFNMDGSNFNFSMPRMPRMNSMPRINGMDFSYSRKPRLGLEIQDLAEGKGVKVLDVDSDTPAAKAGMQKDDVILDIDGKAVASVDELKEKVKNLKEGDTIKVTYQRSGKTQTTDIKFPKKLKTADL